MKAKDVRARHIKGVIENGTYEVKGEVKKTTPNMKGRIKSMFNLMLDYAVEYEIVDRNYARTFEISDDVIQEVEDVKRGHLSFTDEEMKVLWNNLFKVQYVDVILLQCYSGWRPQELVKIELTDVEFDMMRVHGGMKTEAGRDRYVPIHPKVYPMIRKLYEEAVSLNSKYLINCTETEHLRGRNSYLMTYDKYRLRFKKVMETLGLNPDHRPHDPRKQFVTMCKEYKVDDFAIKYMVGHEINDITEKIYTTRKPQWFADEISKIP